MEQSPTASTSRVHDERSDRAIVLARIQEINSLVAQFRDSLINVGQPPRDGPELRERVRKLRRRCVESCKSASQLVLPQMRSLDPAIADDTSPDRGASLERNGQRYHSPRGDESAVDSGIPDDSPNLVLLFFVAQLFLRELHKCEKLVRIVPMDMTSYYANKSGPSNIGNVISQILLCKQITPDFNEEELCSVRKDSAEIGGLIVELQEFMPRSEADTERSIALRDVSSASARINGARRCTRWDGESTAPSYFADRARLFCCASRRDCL